MIRITASQLRRVVREALHEPKIVDIRKLAAAVVELLPIKTEVVWSGRSLAVCLWHSELEIDLVQITRTSRVVRLYDSVAVPPAPRIIFVDLEDFAAEVFEGKLPAFLERQIPDLIKTWNAEIRNDVDLDVDLSESADDPVFLDPEGDEVPKDAGYRLALRLQTMLPIETTLSYDAESTYPWALGVEFEHADMDGSRAHATWEIVSLNSSGSALVMLWNDAGRQVTPINAARMARYVTRGQLPKVIAARCAQLLEEHPEFTVLRDDIDVDVDLTEGEKPQSRFTYFEIAQAVAKMLPIETQIEKTRGGVMLLTAHPRRAPRYYDPRDIICIVNRHGLHAWESPGWSARQPIELLEMVWYIENGELPEVLTKRVAEMLADEDSNAVMKDGVDFDTDLT